MNDYLIETKDLRKYFPTKRGLLHAVEDVNIGIGAGKTLGVVGESGCGKTTLGRVVLQLIPATSGEVFYKGNNVLKSNKKELKKLHNEMQIIFQDPFSSLDPRMTVSELISDPLIVNKKFKHKSELNEYVNDLMEKVGLSQRYLNTYPHELDGGRRQRIGVARALALEPDFIVCDEPVSALDVSIQAQILNLLMDLQDNLGLTYMFITHNLSVVKHISNEVVVMYLGQCIEKAPTSELFKNPSHPYTRALLSAIPVADLSYRNKKVNIIRGEVASPINPKPGCRFAARCEFVSDLCTQQDPKMMEVSEGHSVACVLFK